MSIRSDRVNPRDYANHYLRNAWEPIAVPRWALTLKYALFTVAGILAAVTGVPSLDLTTFNGYVPIWSGFVALGGIIGTFGSIHPRWSAWEAIGGAILVAFLAVLAISFFARGSLSTGLLLTIVTVLPGVRSAFLVTRWAIGMPPGNH